MMRITDCCEIRVDGSTLIENPNNLRKYVQFLSKYRDRNISTSKARFTNEFSTAIVKSIFALAELTNSFVHIHGHA